MSATDQLANLRQHEAEARSALRQAERDLATAKAAVDAERDRLVAAMADDDAKAIAAAKGKRTKADALLADAELELDVAKVKASRATSVREQFHAEHAGDLIAELQEPAVDAVAELAAAGKALVEAQNRWGAVAADCNQHLAASASGKPATDGPPGTSGWETAAREARQAADPPLPLPRMLEHQARLTQRAHNVGLTLHRNAIGYELRTDSGELVAGGDGVPFDRDDVDRHLTAHPRVTMAPVIGRES